MEARVLGNALEDVAEGDDTEDPQMEIANKMTENETPLHYVLCYLRLSTPRLWPSCTSISEFN